MCVFGHVDWWWTWGGMGGGIHIDYFFGLNLWIYSKIHFIHAVLCWASETKYGNPLVYRELFSWLPYGLLDLHIGHRPLFFHLASLHLDCSILHRHVLPNWLVSGRFLSVASSRMTQYGKIFTSSLISSAHSSISRYEYIFMGVAHHRQLCLLFSFHPSSAFPCLFLNPPSGS